MILMFMIAPIVLVNYIIIKIIMSIDEKKTWGAPQGHDRCLQMQNRAGYAAKTPIWRVKWDFKEQKTRLFDMNHTRESASHNKCGMKM